MDWISFIATNALIVVKQLVKNPKSKTKYKNALMAVANAITALYAGDAETAAEHANAGLAEMHD